MLSSLESCSNNCEKGKTLFLLKSTNSFMIFQDHELIWKFQYINFLPLFAMLFQCKMKNLMMDLETNCSEQGGLVLVTLTY